MHKALSYYLLMPLLLLGGVCTQVMAKEFAVIVNVNNTSSESMARQTVKRLYLKQQSTWPDGSAGEAFDRSMDSPEHVAFRRAVAHMSAARLQHHWLSLKQRSGETPPRSIYGTRKLIRLVGKSEGGFGVINLNETDLLSANVRVLFKFKH